MFGEILTTLTGKLSNRFLITAFLPCLVMNSIFLALVVYSIGPTGILETWNEQPIQSQAIIIIFYIALVYFIASLLTAFIGPTIRIYEGYWDDLPLQPIVRCWKDYGKDRYQKELDSLCIMIAENNKKTYSLVNDEKTKKITNIGDYQKYQEELNVLESQEKEAYGKRYHNFPPCTRKGLVMPTRFGNVMRSLESRPGLRYGISSVLLWPDLYMIISEKKGKLIELLTDARSSLESLVFISILGALFSALGILYAIFGFIFKDIEHAVPVFLFLFWGGLVIWWFAYRGSIESARNYGELMNTAFDLHHNELLKTLGWGENLTLDEERKRWAMVNALYYRGKDYGLKYVPTKPPAEQPTKPTEVIITEPIIIKDNKKGDNT